MRQGGAGICVQSHSWAPKPVRTHVSSLAATQISRDSSGELRHPQGIESIKKEVGKAKGYVIPACVCEVHSTKEQG